MLGQLNPIGHYVVSGIKEVGEYLYILLVAMNGETIIKRVKTDNTTILYAKMQEEVGTVNTNNFWADPTIHTYVYLYQIKGLV